MKNRLKFGSLHIESLETDNSNKISLIVFDVSIYGFQNLCALNVMLKDKIIIIIALATVNID